MRGGRPPRWTWALIALVVVLVFVAAMAVLTAVQSAQMP